MFVFKILAFSHQNAAIILLKNDALNANYRHQSYSALHNILINILRVLYITANLHVNHATFHTDVGKYSIDLR